MNTLYTCAYMNTLYTCAYLFSLIQILYKCHVCLVILIATKVVCRCGSDNPGKSNTSSVVLTHPDVKSMWL